MLEQQRPFEKAPDIQRKMTRFRAWERAKRDEISEQREARQYYHSKQWTDTEIRVLKDRNQPVVTSNRIKRKVDFLVGVEQRQRRDPKAFPRTPQHAKGADIVTAGLRAVTEENRWEQHASQGAHDGMTSGIGVVWVGVTNGKQGRDVRIRSGQIDRFFYDPRSVEPDFSDAQYMGMQIWLDIEDAKRRWPEHVDQLSDVAENTSSEAMMAADQDRETQWYDFERQRVRVAEWYEKVPAPTVSGFAWYYCFFTGDLALEYGWSPYVDEDGVPDCPYVAWSPYVDETGCRYGVVRDLKSIQDEINHRRSRFLHWLQVKQLFYQTGMLGDGDDGDIDRMRKELSKPDGLIQINGEWGKDIGIIDVSQDMRGQAELLTEAKAELDGMGPNPALLGQGPGVDAASGRALLAQRDSGMTELSPVFDRLRDWKLRVYRKIYGRMKSAWTGEKWIRITDDPDAPMFMGLNQFGINPQTQQIQAASMVPTPGGGFEEVPGMFSEIDVDIILEEGPDVITMQEELLERLSQLGEAAMGPVGKVMIELSGVSQKDKLLKLLDEAQGEPDPIQQAGVEAEVNQLHAKTENLQANTAKTLSEIETGHMTAEAHLMKAAQQPAQQNFAR